MQVKLLKSKIHRATVTDSSLEYQGSLGIDTDFMEKVGFYPYEKILVANIANGQRFETYVIPAPAGSKTICLNGAAARLGEVGDRLVIMTFGIMSEEEAKQWKPKVIVLDDANKTILREENT